MGVRKLLMASMSTGLVLWTDAAMAAQDEDTNVQNLPAVEVVAPQPTARRSAPRAPTRVVSSGKPKTRIYVYPTAPGNAKGLDVDKVPSSINAVDASQIKRTGSMNVTDALRDNVAGVNITEVSGNPFQPNVEFRGFVASPIVGTPQGLAVYQNGVRINEAFADSVNWDLIPTAAIRSVTVVTNNPAFGLNALGGAVNLQMKDGFTYQGAEIDTMGGSFGRIQSSAQWGKQVDANYAVYAALEGLHDNGFRNFSQSDVRRFYGDVGYKGGDSEFHVNMGLANNNFGASATVPAELLQQYWGAIYTNPQTTNNRVGYVNLTGKVEATPTWTFESTAHARVFEQRVVDGNPTSVQECAVARPALLWRRHHGRQWPQRRAARKPLRDRARCSARSIARRRDRRRSASPRRRPTPTSCSITRIASWSARASMPASRVSTPRPSSEPSAPTTSSAAAGFFWDHPARRRPARWARCRCAPSINIPASMRSTPST